MNDSDWFILISEMSARAQNPPQLISSDAVLGWRLGYQNAISDIVEARWPDAAGGRRSSLDELVTRDRLRAFGHVSMVRKDGHVVCACGFDPPENPPPQMRHRATLLRAIAAARAAVDEHIAASGAEPIAEPPAPGDPVPDKQFHDRIARLRDYYDNADLSGEIVDATLRTDTYDPANGNFLGHQPRGCGKHRSVGTHRAWCFDCREWCYPNDGCIRCRHPEG